MPTVEVNGQECVGMIEIPALGLKLPVISEWSDAKLKKPLAGTVAPRI